ncbi:hypothetical protein [Streptomyces sp. NPDC051561]|uniref:hypothetical protein n=1 Tax=Streptomyces sp. NPDC051561 TaxID=3365658 RepID=UPI0037B409BB
MANWDGGWEPGTAEDLVADARALGVEVTQRTVKNHVEYGLLAPPVRRKSTQRGSDPAIFPSGQRRLSYELHAARLRTTLPRTPYRTMIPIVLHMWYLDDAVIPTAQARRALRTHALSAGIKSAVRRKESAQRVIDQFAHPSATRSQLATAKAWILQGEESGKPNWDAVADTLSAVASPWRRLGLPEIVRGLGPPQAPLTTDTAVAMWELRHQTNSELAFESVTEAALLRAREEHRRQWEQYQQHRPQLMTQAGGLADIFELPADQEQAARQQANGFVTVLGNTLGLARPVFERAGTRAKRR